MEYTTLILTTASPLLVLAGIVFYLIAIARGAARPLALPWLIRLLPPTLSIVALRVVEVPWTSAAILLPAGQLLGGLFIIGFILAKARLSGIGKLSAVDVATLGVTLLAAGWLWGHSDQAAVSIIGLIGINLVATGLHIRDILKKQRTDALLFWALILGGAICSSLAIGGWEWPRSLVPLGTVLNAGSMLIAILVARYTRSKVPADATPISMEGPSGRPGLVV